MSEFKGMRDLSLDETEVVSGGGPGISHNNQMLAKALTQLLHMWGNSKSAQYERKKREEKREARQKKNREKAENGNQVSKGGGFGSDRRIKQDIRAEGCISQLGLTAYTWEYTNAPGERFVGVMAQDLLARGNFASAVFTFQDGPFEGFYGVDYAALGLRCLPVEAWDGDVASLIVSELVAVD